MADEEIIYLDAEEELTNVRERLKHVTARRIIFVIPPQTRLRSHVSWRLLLARAQELKKEVLVVSSDPQIRQVVKKVGFKVADSLASRPPSKVPFGSRPGRKSAGGKTGTSVRTPPGKSLPRQQTIEPAARQPYQAPQQYFNSPATRSNYEAQKGSADIGEDSFEPASPASSTFGMDDRQFGQSHDYGIGSAPSIHPFVPPYEDEGPDLELEDYHQAQSIIQSATNEQKIDTNTMRPPSENIAAPETDPHTYLEDTPAVSLPEQRASISSASVPMHAGDDTDPDITDYPTDPLKIEDQGDMGDIVDRSWTMSAPHDDEDTPGPSRVHNVRPRANRGGNVPPQQPQADNFDDIPLPPPDHQQPRFSPPPVQGRPSGNLDRGPVKSPPTPASKGNRAPQPVFLPQPRPQPATGSPPLKKRPTNVRNKAAAPPRPSKQPAISPSQRARKTWMSAAGVPILVVILTLLILGLLTYFSPSADVTITLPSQSFPSQMKLTATATSHQDVVHQTLPAETLVFDSSVTGRGVATGTTTVGTKAAAGQVIFTNTGNSSIVIPTGTIVATNSGIQFATTAEAEVFTAPNNTIPAPVQAQSPGSTGNVLANTITSIPPGSLSGILQANPGLNKVTLTVTNPSPTTGGGAGNATSVSNNDLKKEQATLDTQLQAQIKDFLKKNLHPGDQPGKPIQTGTPSVTPPVGQVVTDGIFTETLKLHMTVLVVRAADLQAAATAQLKQTLLLQGHGLALVPQQNVVLKQLKNQPARDGKSLVLSFTAVGQVAPQISEDTVRNLISGKTAADAKSALSDTNGIPNILNSQIVIHPSFFHWLPFWPQRINVHFKTMPEKQLPAPKPKRT